MQLGRLEIQDPLGVLETLVLPVPPVPPDPLVLRVQPGVLGRLDLVEPRGSLELRVLLEFPALLEARVIQVPLVSPVNQGLLDLLELQDLPEHLDRLVQPDQLVFREILELPEHQVEVEREVRLEHPEHPVLQVARGRQAIPEHPVSPVH